MNSNQPAAIPVWTDPAGGIRYAALDLGAFFHRGDGPALPLRLWNSLGQSDWPTMSQITIAARPQSTLSSAVLAAHGLQLRVAEWQSLQSPVPLPDLGSGEGIDLWIRLTLPGAISPDLVMGRLRFELLVSWE